MPLRPHDLLKFIICNAICMLLDLQPYSQEETRLTSWWIVRGEMQPWASQGENFVE